VLVGIADRALSERAANPYFVVMLGGNLGNMVGMARGDTAAFFMELMLGLVTLAVLLGLMKVTYGKVAAAFAPLPVPAGVPAGLEPPHAEGYPDTEEDHAWETT
jgi:hypothetical protein